MPKLTDRATWYLDRIDDLLRVIRETPRPDGDDIAQCQERLRELLARFRADARAPRDVPSLPERHYAAAIADAASMLRVSANSRPTNRWRDDLGVCRARIHDYLAHNSVPGPQMAAS